MSKNFFANQNVSVKEKLEWTMV